MSGPLSPPYPLDERARLAAAAAALARQGEPEAALAQYRALLAIAPGDPDAAANAGLMARRCGREEDVLPLVQAVAEVNRGHPRLWQVLGLMHRALDELDPALAALERAAGLAPRDPLVAHGLARAALEAGRPALDLFRRATELAPGDDAVRLGLVAALVADERWPEAAELLESELRRRPGWVEGHVKLAGLRWMMGEGEHFTGSFQEAAERAPDDLALWGGWLVALCHDNRYAEALDIVARGRAAAGPNPLFDANEAICLAESGRTDAADRMFARLRPIEEPTLAIRYVRHLLRSGRTEAAVAEADAWAETPHRAFFWPYLAAGWRMLDDPRWQWLEGDPRLVGVYDLAADLPPLDRLAAVLRELHVTKNQPLEQSVRGGTQTDGTLFSRTEPEIRALRGAALNAVRAHIAQLPPFDPRHPQLGLPRNAPIRFSGSWSVRLTGGGRHANHVHPVGWFSSALYIALPAPDERGPAPAGWLTLGAPQAELGLALPPFREIEPRPGRLVLFPSTMWHGTNPFDAGERLTVAFDVAPPL